MKALKFLLFLVGLIIVTVVNVVLAVIFDAKIAAYVIVDIIVISLVFYLSDALCQDAENSKCYKCGKHFAMVELSRKFVRSEEGTVAVRTQNASGRSCIRDIPARKDTYLCIEECKYCGYRREVHKSEVLRYKGYGV